MGSKMKKNEISVRFAGLVDKAHAVNGRAKDKRFYPMQEIRGGRLSDFGMYDYHLKRYVLSSVHANDAPSALAEIEKMLARSK
jgi:hypothetical protein